MPRFFDRANGVLHISDRETAPGRLSSEPLMPIPEPQRTTPMRTRHPNNDGRENDYISFFSGRLLRGSFDLRDPAHSDLAVVNLVVHHQ